MGEVKQFTKAHEVHFPDISSSGKRLGTQENLKALLNGLDIRACMNEMNLEIEIFSDKSKIGESYEQKRSYLVSEVLKADLPKSILDDHLAALCEANPYHPVRAFIDSGEQWDKTLRIEPLVNAMNSLEPTLTRKIMVKFLVGCVACLYENRFSNKLVPILQGGQSFCKTAFIRRFASTVPYAFLEGAELNPDNKDSVISCIKCHVAELGELERTSRNSQGSLKAFITKSEDTVRLPCGRADIKKKRQTMLIGTVNGTEFLNDDTGSSRYAVIELANPIDMGEVNQILGWSYNNGRLKLTDPYQLQQFWLEVKHLYDNGMPWDLNETELKQVQEVNNKHNFKQNWQQVLEERFLGVEMTHREWEWMAASEVCRYCEIPTNHTRLVGKALKAMAQDGSIETKSGSANKTLYRLPIIHNIL
jgi:predicted P-loop ATPase